MQSIAVTGDMILEKLEYIHQTSVEAGWVSEPYDYYSSAWNYARLNSPLKVISVFDEIEI
jgi:hypothetical protein